MSDCVPVGSCVDSPNPINVRPVKLTVWLILSVIWGLTWLAVRLGLDDLPPVTFAGIRFLAAAAILWPILLAIALVLLILEIILHLGLTKSYRRSS